MNEDVRPDPTERERPLGAYAVIATGFGLLFGAPLALAARRDALPERLAISDIALLAAGTFKLSRLITRDAVTGFVRAPFVEYEGMEGVSAPKERPRGAGLRRALGQLLLCPDCTALWVGAALATSLTVAPRATRISCGALAAVTASDFLQHAYHASDPER